MTLRTKKTIFVSLAVLLIFVAGWVARSIVPEPAGRLMLITGDSLTATTIENGKQSITITGVPPTTMWFTDRPEHVAGAESTEDLLTEFFTNYPNNPPNATISMLVDGQPETRIITLSEPVFNGSTIEFTSTPLENDPWGVVPSLATYISITIDDASDCSGPAGWCTVIPSIGFEAYGFGNFLSIK
jgi:hypothetical protein